MRTYGIERACAMCGLTRRTFAVEGRHGDRRTLCVLCMKSLLPPADHPAYEANRR